MPKPDLEWVPVSEACRRLGINRQRVHQLIRTGELESLRVGPLWLVSARSVEARLKNFPKGQGRRRWARIMQSRKRR
jgi:excisionase family DNA binding protein